MYTELWCEISKERDQWEDPDLCGSIKINSILEKYDGVQWIPFFWLRIRATAGLL
jgi:hypothetical protein